MNAKPRNLHYYVLSTLSSLLGYLDDQCSELLKSWMACLDFAEFPDLLEHYTTIGNGKLLKKEYTTIENHTLLEDIDKLMYLTQLNSLEDTPNQILVILSTLKLWMKPFYATIGKYPTVEDFLAITQDELMLWE